MSTTCFLFLWMLCYPQASEESKVSEYDESHDSELFAADELYAYRNAAVRVGWLPHLYAADSEAKLVRRLGLEVFELLREAEQSANDLENRERCILDERLGAASSHESRMKLVVNYVEESHSRGRAFYESVDELVSPSDREFMVSSVPSFSLLNPWHLAAIGADAQIITSIEDRAGNRAERWVNDVLAMRKNTKLTVVLGNIEESKILQAETIEALRLLTPEQQRKGVHFKLGLPLAHSKTDVRQKMQLSAEPLPIEIRNNLSDFIDNFLKALKYE